MSKTLCLAIICIAITGHDQARADDGDSRQGGNGIDVRSEAFNTLRDPFWPVGYKPASESEKIEHIKIADLKARISWPVLPLRGITHAGGKRYVAFIEGVGLVEAGDIVVIEQDSLIYRWMIDNVSSRGVTSTPLDVTEKVGN